jgi:phospholipid transport system transporter-binding protein
VSPRVDNVRLDEAGGGTWKLTGELGFATVAGLLKETRNGIPGDADARIDLSGVTRADSAGLALLVEWLRVAERRGGSVTFVNMPEQMQSIARVCGLEAILNPNATARSGDG